jgi:hypothetical protein
MKIYILAIMLIVLTGALGYGFALAFDAHSTLALVGAVAGLLIYAPSVWKIARAIGKELGD